MRKPDMHTPREQCNLCTRRSYIYYSNSNNNTGQWTRRRGKLLSKSDTIITCIYNILCSAKWKCCSTRTVYRHHTGTRNSTCQNRYLKWFTNKRKHIYTDRNRTFTRSSNMCNFATSYKCYHHRTVRNRCNDTIYNCWWRTCNFHR
jgi:hypothetical protein